jgi:hypothetical protein
MISSLFLRITYTTTVGYPIVYASRYTTAMGMRRACRPVPHHTNTTCRYWWPSGGIVGEQLKMSRTVRVLVHNEVGRGGTVGPKHRTVQPPSGCDKCTRSRQDSAGRGSGLTQQSTEPSEHAHVQVEVQEVHDDKQHADEGHSCGRTRAPTSISGEGTGANNAHARLLGPSQAVLRCHTRAEGTDASSAQKRIATTWPITTHPFACTPHTPSTARQESIVASGLRAVTVTWNVP